jgi:hypothetical protein
MTDDTPWAIKMASWNKTGISMGQTRFCTCYPGKCGDLVVVVLDLRTTSLERSLSQRSRSVQTMTNACRSTGTNHV